MRLEGWEHRLADVIEAARSRPYVLGQDDCFRLACSVVEALTGVDHWADWGGKYHTKREALALIASYGSNFTDAFTRLFDVEPIEMNFAHRGDIAELQDETGEKHLGVVIDVHVAVMREHGVDFVVRSSCRHAWRIG
jgi:hypothetical protein